MNFKNLLCGFRIAIGNRKVGQNMSLSLIHSSSIYDSELACNLMESSVQPSDNWRFEHLRSWSAYTGLSLLSDSLVSGFPNRLSEPLNRAKALGTRLAFAQLIGIWGTYGFKILIRETIYWCQCKGSAFSSIILRPWVEVRQRTEPESPSLKDKRGVHKTTSATPVSDRVPIYDTVRQSLSHYVTLERYWFIRCSTHVPNLINIYIYIYDKTLLRVL
jgi:hypothetical protein